MLYQNPQINSSDIAGDHKPEEIIGLSTENTDNESYNTIKENEFKKAVHAPLSTFSIDVDQTSYSNVRRFINYGKLPPSDAVRIEEMINYFTYDYPQPKGDDPFSFHTEVSLCPWNTHHQLVHIGIKGKEVQTENIPPSNLVFLLDVSGSMEEYNKLPLLKSAFQLLVKNLRPQDNVAIVVYAGASGLVLPSTPGDQKRTILLALDQLQAGGSTAGAAGIELAYKIAQQSFIKNGNNRIILATDGDFNVGARSDAAMEHLIERKRDQDVFLSVLGFGMGNYKDSKMEVLADKGNGNYAYIDNMNEARKVLVHELSSTLYTIAKDVKIQVEFNPAQVKAYRLIGYENRILQQEDFNDDGKDAGELGAGHTVTALYEIIPADSEEELTTSIDPLRYQEQSIKSQKTLQSELLNLKLRYKLPDGITSKKLSRVVRNTEVAFENTSNNYRFAAAVAGYGMLLRNSRFIGHGNFNMIKKLAEGAVGKDPYGYRNEFIELVELTKQIKE